MQSRKSGKLVASVIILIGAILLIAALFVPWYSEETSGFGITETVNAHPGLPSSNGTLTFSCSGTSSCPSQTSYSDQNQNNTGAVAETGFFMLLGGFVLGLLAAILGLMSRGKPGRPTAALGLAVLALILAIAAPGLFAASLPGAISKDTPNHTGSSGPWASFYGSTSASVEGTTFTTTWGPAIGWYLSIAAFVILLIGVILLLRARDAPPPAMSPPPMTAPASSDMTPPASPPSP